MMRRGALLLVLVVLGACSDRSLGPGDGGRDRGTPLADGAPRRDANIIARDAPISRDRGLSDAGGICGPFPGGQCQPGQVCNITGCQPGASGTCQTRPTTCNGAYAPVCGCNNKTFGNDCLRLVAGVPLKHLGKCTTYKDAAPPVDGPLLPDAPLGLCGPFPGGLCPGGMVCDIESCLLGAAGICKPMVLPCPKLWSPVCGCNGTTYANNCFRLQAGVSLAHLGPCPGLDAGVPPDAALPPPSDAAIASCGPWPGGQCPAGMVCDIHSCYTGASGTCTSQPTSCPTLWAPVCGCDNQTYANDCFRLQAGVPRQHFGACPTLDGGPMPDASFACGNYPGGACNSGQVCDIFGCSSYATGSCVGAPINCPFVWDPVCGCNYQTYANDCIRLLTGTPLMHKGACAVDGGQG